MKLKLKNIGTLKQAEIDLSKDLIILAGPNNTGKTYAAYTVYGVCELLRNRSFSEFDDYDNAINMITATFSNSKKEENEVNISISDFLEQFEITIKNICENGSENLLKNVLAENSNNFINSELEIILDKNKLYQYLVNLDVGESIVGSLIAKVGKGKGDEVFNLSVYISNQEDKKKVLSHIKWAYQRMALWTAEAYFKNCYINTAERSAINIFSKELSIKRNTIVDQLLELRESKSGVANQLLDKLQRYSLPIRDSLEISEDLANLSRNKSEYAFLADKMEEVLLDGKINISKYGEVQYSPNKSKVKNLSMNLSGSIVKSLSSLVIYFRHLAKKGDFIIIDEPELNLHPDNQRKITRLIGEFVNHGFKVMISTHSDYIIRELNNMTMLKIGGDKAEYLANKYGYKTEQLIDYQKIGAYLFHKNKNISLEVTEIGFEVGTIDEEINNLNNASEEIYFTLFD